MNNFESIADQLEGSHITKVENINLKDWNFLVEETLIVKKKFSILFKQCIYIDFKGFQYQISNTSSSPSIICCGIKKNSELLNNYFSQKSNSNEPSPTTYLPRAKQTEKKSNFQHAFFQSFDVDIDILCNEIEISEFEEVGI